MEPNLRGRYSHGSMRRPRCRVPNDANAPGVWLQHLLSRSLRMRFPKPVLVTVFESEVPILLIAGPLLLEIFLNHHVQLRRGR
jgi:hypothetical protein